MGTYGGAISFQGIQASATGCEFKSCTGLQGAAVRLSGNDGTIDHCLFKSCNPGEGTVQAIGATVTIRDSTFDTGQSAYGGAAIHGLSSAVLVEDSTFAGLDSGGDGGAIFLRDSYTTVRRSVFRDNETSASGGAILAWYGTLSVEDTNFEDNEAYGFGGAIHSRYCDPLVLSGCTCSRNRAVGGSGGGICIEQIGIGAVSVHDCRFVSNTGHDGGAISLHAAANIARCVFSANEGALGGGAIQEDAPPASLTTIDHCTFYGNKNPPGGALRVYGAGKISVSNSLIWKNRVPQIENLGATLTVSYTDIEALPSVYSGNGNFDSFPALYAPALHDFHLRAGSPCIDAGDPAAPVDLDGTRTDIGAIAYQPNYATQPDTYCTAGTSTHGCVPTIGWVGTASASAATAFTITASGLEGQKSGLVFYGTNGSASLPWGITSSLMCVEPPMQRTPVLSSAGTDGNCDGAMSLDWNTFLASTPSALGSPFAAGDVVWAQCWYRDPPAPKTTQLSNALEFVIEP
jgi:predicted outer membrane repeat protein